MLISRQTVSVDVLVHAYIHACIVSQVDGRLIAFFYAAPGPTPEQERQLVFESSRGRKGVWSEALAKNMSPWHVCALSVRLICCWRSLSHQFFFFLLCTFTQVHPKPCASKFPAISTTPDLEYFARQAFLRGETSCNFVSSWSSSHSHDDAASTAREKDHAVSTRVGSATAITGTEVDDKDDTNANGSKTGCGVEAEGTGNAAVID